MHQKPQKVKHLCQDFDSLLTPEESQERIVLLLIISGFILSFFFGLLFIWVLFISSGIKDLVILEPDLSKPQVVGFPIPHLGILDGYGTFFTFISPFLDTRYEKSIDLTKIAKPKKDKQSQTTSNIMVFSWHSDIFFLYADPERAMIRFETLGNRHQIIDKSTIPIYQKHTTKGNITEKMSGMLLPRCFGMF